MFDNITEQDEIDGRGESDMDEGEDGGARHRRARFRHYNQDLHHDLSRDMIYDGEGGESGDENNEADVSPSYRHKTGTSSKPQNLDLLPSSYIDQGEEVIENCEVVDDDHMPESIFNDKYAGEESSELSFEEQTPPDEHSSVTPGETQNQHQERDVQSNEADGAQSASLN